jgi:hypothetical protein
LWYDAASDVVNDEESINFELPIMIMLVLLLLL